MITKKNLVELMINKPEAVGLYFFQVGNRVIFTVHKEHVEWSSNRRFRWPVKRQVRHTSFLMPTGCPTVTDPDSTCYYIKRVLEEAAERSIGHTLRGHWQERVAEAFGLDPKQINYQGYKVVAVKDGKYLSLYDGVTEYKIGERLEQATKRDHQGGYYVLGNIEDCNGGNIPLPHNAALRLWPHRAILKVKYGGKIVRYKRKVAASWIQPTHVVSTFA